jgi:hypothetical protein
VAPATGPGLTSRDGAFFDQHVQVDQALPVVGAEQHDGHRLGLAGLHQREHLEQFVQRAKAAGEGHQRLGAHHEVHLAQREVVELEAQRAATRRGWPLLVRQGDVQAHRGRPHVVGAAVGGFHDAGAAAGADVDAVGWGWRRL